MQTLREHLKYPPTRSIMHSTKPGRFKLSVYSVAAWHFNRFMTFSQAKWEDLPEDTFHVLMMSPKHAVMTQDSEYRRLYERCYSDYDHAGNFNGSAKLLVERMRWINHQRQIARTQDPLFLPLPAFQSLGLRVVNDFFYKPKHVVKKYVP